MKKYIILSIIAAFFFSGCVKDEQPAPGAPNPENYGDIVINELMTKDVTNPYFISGNGDPADWVELYNKGNKSVNIAGMWITDKPGNEEYYIQIPSTHINVTTIPPKGFVVLICGAKDSGGADLITSIVDGKIFIDMGISSSNDSSIAIYTPEKALVDESPNFNGVEEDKSFGRTSDGGPDWNTLNIKTPGAPNDDSAPVIGSLIINEFMASNDVVPVPGDNGDFPDWIEIYNTGDTPIDMGGWYTSDAMDDLMQYQLPTDNPGLTTVPAHGFLILYCDGTGEGLHTNFKLSSGGEDIIISRDGTTVTEGYSYCDTTCDLPNPPTNSSCGRNGDGNAAWVIFTPETATPPTPGAANGTQK